MTKKKNEGGGNGVSEKTIIEQVERIKELRTLGATDSQIIRNLGITKSSFNRRIRRLNEASRYIMQNRFRSELLTEVDILHDRMLRTIQNCEAIARSETVASDVKLEAERLKIDVSIALVKLLHEGPSTLGIQTTDVIITKQQELDNKYPDTLPSWDAEPDIYNTKPPEDFNPQGEGTPGRTEDYRRSSSAESDTQ
jgi:hypothetical protein